jgi:peptidoglycan/LPS O-acetylase OafA/YrhL
MSCGPPLEATRGLLFRLSALTSGHRMPKEAGVRPTRTAGRLGLDQRPGASRQGERLAILLRNAGAVEGYGHGDGIVSPFYLSARRTVGSAGTRERITALDGLRAVALLIIMGYHFGVGWLQGGFFSLDIFYVLSGYLITGLLLDEYRKRDRIKLSAFWLRRARRLLPALLIVLVAVTLMVRFAEPAGLYTGFRMDALSALFYFSNWWQIATSSNYFVVTGAVSPLTHTWSLAVEEQFYLIWPLVTLAVMSMSRTFGRGVKTLLVLSATGAAASALEMAILFRPGANITRLYFGTDTHAQSILVGATLACVMTILQPQRGGVIAPVARSRFIRWALIVVGVSGLAGTLTLTYLQNGTSSFDYQGGFLLSALSAAAIIIAAVCVPDGPIASVLSLRPLVWLGTISYGAYLWHYPVFIYLDGARTGARGSALLAIRFAVTIVLATLSFYLVERPVMVGTFWRSLRAAIPAIALMAGTVSVVIACTGSEALAIPAVVVPPRATTPTGGKAIPVLLVGDSTALTLGFSLAYAPEESKYGVAVINAATEGCGIAEGRFVEVNGTSRSVTGSCNSDSPVDAQWPALLEQDVLHYRPRVVVLLAGYWEAMDRTNLAGQVTNITDPSYASYVESQLQRFVSIASSAGSGVVLMTAPYYDASELPNGQPPPQDDPVRVNDYNRVVRAVASASPKAVTLIDLNHIVSPDGQFTGTIGDVVVRAPDGIHFVFDQPFDETAALPDTAAQVGSLARWIDPKLLPLIIQAAHDKRALSAS